jgi:predicted cupin superfamily sugar epimerase
MTADSFSALHRLPGDEIWHFYLGDPIEQLQLSPDGSGKIIEIGNNLLAGQVPQIIVPGDVWQGSKLKAGGKFALVGTTMSPGYEFEDYEAGERDELILQYPEFSSIISQLTNP